MPPLRGSFRVLALHAYAAVRHLSLSAENSSVRPLKTFRSAGRLVCRMIFRVCRQAPSGQLAEHPPPFG